MKKAVIFLIAILFVILPVMSSCTQEEVVPPTVVISPAEVEMAVGDVYTLNSIVFPNKYKDMDVIWFVSNSDVIECVDGRISAKAPGIANVYATVGSSRHSCKVTVREASRNMIVGETIAVLSSQQKLIREAKEIVTTSGAVSYENGIITANEEGKALVIAKYENGDFLTLADVWVRDISLTCDEMPLTVVCDSEKGIEIEAYDLEVYKELYGENNYSINFSFKFKRVDNAQSGSLYANFKVVLYSGEVEGEFCRERVLSVKMKPGEEYEYVDDGFRAMLGEDGNRTFWIEIMPLEEK